METYKGKPTFYAKSAKAWRDWLSKNHETAEAIWLILYRKESTTPSVYYNEAVDEALCFGWVDSAPNKRDEESYYQYFAKRNPKSNWSRVNKEKVAQLQQADKMALAGLAMVALAKQQGTWTFLDEIEKGILPEDLAEALQANNLAHTHWKEFPRSVRRGIMEWIITAKRPETRQKRVSETVALAAENKRANQFR